MERLDLRSDDEREVEQRARQPLPADLEQLAGRVGQLGHDYQTMGDALWQEMQSIGQQLHARGGHPLMLLVCYRAKNLGGRYTSVSKSWNGIGSWSH